MEKLTVFAPAKINLHLAILNRRSDGFHNLESVFAAVDFGDTLHFEPIEDRNSAEITMVNEISRMESLSMEKNIIFQALSLFREKTGFKQGFKITAEKRIPMGGGLGGGSSNAAATILALNRQAGFPLSREELLGMASALGSDVPFFVYETGAAWVTGRGEHIRPVKVPDLFFVLVNPGFSSDTARAFKLLDEYPENYRLGDRARKVNLFSASGHFYGINFESFYNDFLPVFNEPEKSVYNSIISQLYELGADFANLSGAGSTCFGVFSKREQAEKASENLHDKWSFVKCCKIKSDF